MNYTPLIGNWVGIILLPKKDSQNYFSKIDEVQCREDVPAKRKAGVGGLLYLVALPATSISISFVLITQIVHCVHAK